MPSAIRRIHRRARARRSLEGERRHRLPAPVEMAVRDEADLLAGSPQQPNVAVVAPRSTQMFNGSLDVNDSTQGHSWATTMDYMCEALSLVTR